MYFVTLFSTHEVHGSLILFYKEKLLVGGGVHLDHGGEDGAHELDILTIFCREDVHGVDRLYQSL